MQSTPQPSPHTSSTPSGVFIRRVEVALALATVTAALATIPITVLQQTGAITDELRTWEWCIWAVFALEYGFTGFVSGNWWAHTRRNWLSALVVFATFPLVANLFSLVGLVRLTRLFYLVRVYLILGWGVRALAKSAARRGIVYLAMTTVLIVFVGGGLITLVEPDVVGDSFASGIWWAIVTTTTVGYGDIAPHSLGGRLIAVVLMFAGMGLVSSLAGTVAAHFMEYAQEQARREQEEAQDQPAPEPTGEMAAIIERLDRIERRLEELVHRDPGPPSAHS